MKPPPDTTWHDRPTPIGYINNGEVGELYGIRIIETPALPPGAAVIAHPDSARMLVPIRSDHPDQMELPFDGPLLDGLADPV